jgi:hypothetical protein
LNKIAPRTTLQSTINNSAKEGVAVERALLAWPTFVALLDPAALDADKTLPRQTDSRPPAAPHHSAETELLTAIPLPSDMEGMIDDDQTMHCADMIEIRRVLRIVSSFRSRRSN